MLQVVGNIHTCPFNLEVEVGHGIHLTSSLAIPHRVRIFSKSEVAKYHVVLKTRCPVLPPILSSGTVQIFISGNISISPLTYHYPYVEVACGDWWVHHGDLTPEIAHEVEQAFFGGNVYVVKVYSNISDRWRRLAKVIDADVGKVRSKLMTSFAYVRFKTKFCIPFYLLLFHCRRSQSIYFPVMLICWEKSTSSSVETGSGSRV